MVKYYIKDKIIYSSILEEFVLYTEDLEFKIPHDTKNHLTNNKIIIKSLKNIKNSSENKIKLTAKINTYKNIRDKILKNIKDNKSILVKPKDDDYEFIEKTSQIEIIDGVLATNPDDSLKYIKKQIDMYIDKNSSIENEKNVQLDEQIEIENNKKKEYKKSKLIFIEENITSDSNKKNDMNSEITKFNFRCDRLNIKLDIIQSNENNDSTVYNLEKEIDKNKHKQENIKFEIKIMKSKITMLKDEIKLGRQKCVNWFLFVLTLGLIYWSNYSTCKHKALRITSKINKKKEKLLLLEQKLYNLEQKISDRVNMNNLKYQDSHKIEDKIIVEIDEIKTQLHDKNNEVKKIEKEINKHNKELDKFDKQIEKIDNKLIDLNSIKNEFIKYSCNRVKDEFKSLDVNIRNKVNKLEDLKKNIKEQKIEIKGEWIIEV